MEQTVEETQVIANTPQRVVKTTKVGTAAIDPEHPVVKYKKKKAIFRMYQVIWYIVGLIEILLLFRVAFKALGANPYSGFVYLIYRLTDPLALPFSGIFGVTVTQGAVFEWSTFVAGIVYLLIGYGLVQLMQLIKPTTPEEVEETVDNT